MTLIRTLTASVFLLACLPAQSQTTGTQPAANTNSPVGYEDFGAVGDGITDDLPAIVKAHQHANRHTLPVRSKPDATYHLGRKALTAIIATDTDWNTSRFIIDDSQGVDNHNRSLFEVSSLLKPEPLEIDNLKRDQARLSVRPSNDCLVYVENNKHRMFIRRGGNQNSGTPQKEVFLLRKDGTIEGGIDWDYPTVTRVEAYPIDETPLLVRGGIFTNIANRTDSASRSGYWRRNIHITRSLTTIDGVTHKVTGESDQGKPYNGFLTASKCTRIAFRNCVIDGRKVYKKMGKTGHPVPMGTYGYQANLVLDLRMINCRMGNDIHDGSRWGVVASNFMKNFLVEDSVLSRVDVHMGVSGNYIIRRSTIGHAGINAIGRGRLVVEDCTLHDSHIVSFREDYGSTWNGEVLIRNCHWFPPKNNSNTISLLNMHNDGTHDFGYPCSMPHTVRIDNLTIDDSHRPKAYQGPTIFSNPGISPPADARFPYLPSKLVEIRKLTTASGLPLRISTNPLLSQSIKMDIQ